ncbi:GTPase Era [Helicobacter anatolicus]|uniref:GTPase Era n=1 Tax=Helicobacter anatolicus TaxID=2905874 RepID=UPI001E57D63C|nr:GTPase Era [Helicobacter anatolicus]MCE3038466.1 GTPase Era [Helicobacter anatolicus]
MKTKCGFVGVIGKPNAGKSTFLNKIVGQNIALVSHKVNATRKRMNFIVPFEDIASGEMGQIIFVDTPGLDYQEKLLNQFMLKEALRVHQESDIILFIASATDTLEGYEEFLHFNENKPHVVLLNKIDLLSQEKILAKIALYQKYQDKFLAIFPMSAKKDENFHQLLKTIHTSLPYAPFLFDSEDLTDLKLRDIYKELIRESVFNNLSDELPYESDVVVEKVIESDKIEKIFAKIFVEKESQKSMVIGSNANTIKRIGKSAREKIEHLIQKKVFLQLNVFVHKSWSKEKDKLKFFGYDID